MKTSEADRYGVGEKCRAVLAVWTVRRQASVLCREMGMSASLLSQWQDRALAGMLQALEPRGPGAVSGGPALPELVKRLLDRKARARELETLGRSAGVRPRPAGGKAPATTPPATAGS